MIQFDNLSCVFPDGTHAVRAVSLHIPKGQFCVFLGPSGAGKSTLLKLVNGMQQPTSGSVRINGERLEARSRRRLQRQVAMIHQHFNLVNRVSVEANILAGAIAQVPAWRVLTGQYPTPMRRRAAHLLAELGLEELHFRRRAAELSGGQQQRVGIARAFLMHPAVVLADEPVASLDPAISADILAGLRAMARENGATVLCSLHQVELAKAFADRIIGLRAGQVVFDGDGESLDAACLKTLYENAS